MGRRVAVAAAFVAGVVRCRRCGHVLCSSAMDGSLLQRSARVLCAAAGSQGPWTSDIPWAFESPSGVRVLGFPGLGHRSSASRPGLELARAADRLRPLPLPPGPLRRQLLLADAVSVHRGRGPFRAFRRGAPARLPLLRLGRTSRLWPPEAGSGAAGQGRASAGPASEAAVSTAVDALPCASEKTPEPAARGSGFQSPAACSPWAPISRERRAAASAAAPGAVAVFARFVAVGGFSPKWPTEAAAPVALSGRRSHTSAVRAGACCRHRRCCAARCADCFAWPAPYGEPEPVQRPARPQPPHPSPPAGTTATVTHCTTVARNGPAFNAPSHSSPSSGVM